MDIPWLKYACVLNEVMHCFVPSHHRLNFLDMSSSYGIVPTAIPTFTIATFPKESYLHHELLDLNNGQAKKGLFWRKA